MKPEERKLMIQMSKSIIDIGNKVNEVEKKILGMKPIPSPIQKFQPPKENMVDIEMEDDSTPPDHAMKVSQKLVEFITIFCKENKVSRITLNYRKTNGI